MAVEDFTTYTEVDAGTNITKTATRVTFTSLARGNESYVYKDKSAGYFDGDFTHLLTINISAHTAGAEVAAIWVMANLIDDIRGIDIDSSGDALFLLVINPSSPDEVRLQLTELDGGTPYGSTPAYYVLTKGTTYYLKIVRDESVGTYGTLYCYIYSDAGRATLLATLSVALHTSKKDFRYIYPLSVWKAGGAYYITGYVENLTLYKATAGYAATYPTDAITRVTSLIHRYDRGTYTLELNLGEVVSDFGLPEWESKPRAGIEPTAEEKETFRREEDERLRRTQIVPPTPTEPTTEEKEAFRREEDRRMRVSARTIEDQRRIEEQAREWERKQKALAFRREEEERLKRGR